MPIYTIISYNIYSELFILTRNLFPLYLQGGYPARLKKVLIVTAPLWFKAPFKILRLFVREKLRERVFTVSVPQLSLHVPRKALPVHLGGTLEIDHATWLLTCRASMTNREDELLANIVAPGPAAATPLSNGGGGGGGSSTSSNSNNDTNSSSAVSSAASSSNINGATAAATIISAVHQLAESNTTVVTVGTAAAGIESTTQSTSTQQQQSTEPNENITINGLSPSHRLKLNTSGIQQQQQLQQPINGDSTTASTAAAAGSVAALNGSAATAAGAGAGAGAGVAAAAAAAGAAAAGGAAGEFWTENPPSSASSGFSDDDSLAGQEGDPKTIEQIVQMVRERCRQGLVKEYADIRNRAPEGTFLHAR